MLHYFNSVLTDWLWLQTNMKNIDGLKLHSIKTGKERLLYSYTFKLLYKHSYMTPWKIAKRYMLAKV